MLDVAYNILLPIFVIIGISALIGRHFQPDLRTISTLIIYLFNPSLIIDNISNSAMEGDEVMRIAAAVVLVSFLCTGMGWLLAKWRGYQRQVESAFMLSIAVMNAANYGLPVNELAFGVPGRERAIIYYTVSAIMAYTLGTFLASRGNQSAWRALLNVFKVPLPYAVVIGFILRSDVITLPAPLGNSIALMAQATIPAMLVMLGIQLANTSVRGLGEPIFLAATMRLVFSPIIAIFLTVLLNLDGVARNVVIVQSAMPTAVVTGVLSVQFGGDSEFAAAAIMISTLSSIVTLSVILTLLS